MTERDTDMDNLNLQNALRAHQVHYAYLEKGGDAASSSGHVAVKNLFLMHGGALIAMLTFTSGILNNSTSSVRADSLVDPMMLFAIGLACAAAASAGTYLTNYCYVAGAQNQTLVFQKPYVEKNRASKLWEGFGVAFHIATVLLALGSLILFVCGFWGVKDALTATHGPTQINATSDEAVSITKRPASDTASADREADEPAGVRPDQGDAP